MCRRLEEELASLPNTAAAGVSTDRRIAQASTMGPVTSRMHVWQGRKRERDDGDDGRERSSSSCDPVGTAPKRERRR